MWQKQANWLKCGNKRQGGIRLSSVFRPEWQHSGTPDRKQEAAGKRELVGGMRWQQQDIRVDIFSGRLEMRPEAWRRPGCAASGAVAVLRARAQETSRAEQRPDD